jgi:hypothetical protein
MGFELSWAVQDVDAVGAEFGDAAGEDGVGGECGVDERQDGDGDAEWGEFGE